MANSIEGLLKSAAKQLDGSSPTATLDSEILLCHCLAKNRSYLRAWPENPVCDETASKFKTLIEKRQKGVPVAYLTGQREFWSRSFKVNPNVLIPRPDSELLIELSLSFLDRNQIYKILDLGAGSGILAITIATERPLAEVTAAELCAKALDVAKQNAERLHTSSIRFVKSHWFDAIKADDFDLILSNPPYIDCDDPHLKQGDVRFEPIQALVSAENGLLDIRHIAKQSRQHLKIGGRLLIEHGYNQHIEVQRIFNALSYDNVTTYPDLSGLPRVTSGIWNPT